MYKFYGCEPSFFSGKVRGYLRYKKIPFTEIVPSLKVSRKVIVARVNRPIIPILIAPNDECIQDSSCIIEYLEERHSEYSPYPASPKQKLAASLLELYGDEWLTIPAMHTRWNFLSHNLKFIVSDFGKVFYPTGWPLMQKLSGLFLAAAVTISLKNKFGATRKIGKGVDRSLSGLISEMNVHLEKYPYFFGDRPSIADYSFNGLFYGHLVRDPYPRTLLEDKAPFVLAWTKRVQLLNDAKYGDFVPDDEIPITLIPILKRMTREQFPVLEETNVILDQWVKDNPKTGEVKRFIGKHNYELEGVTGTRSIMPFSCWMLQRSLDIYDESENKRELDGFLEKIGGRSVFKHRANTRLTYQNFRLMVDK